jgi:glycosyltransferase involved in cell wall biosynthesis
VVGHQGRVVLVDTEMGRVLGGAQTFLLRLIPELDRRGCTTTVVCEPPAPPFAGTLRSAGVDVSTALIRYPRIVDDSARRIARWVNALRPAAYIVSVSSGSAWAAVPLLDPCIPSLAIVHSDDETFYRPLGHYRDVVDLAVAVSEPIHDHLTTSLGLSPDQVLHVPYGVDRKARSRTAGDRLKVAFLGRLTERDKQISILARAANRLRDAPVDLTVAGDGPDALRFREELGEGSHVRLLGHVPADVAAATMQASDCLVLTSTGREGMPLAVLEARACGTVPVLSDIPAHAALVDHGIDGLLVPAGDADALASTLRSLAGDPSRLARLSAASHQRAARTTVETMTDGYEEAVRRATARRRKGAPRPAVPLMPSCLSRWPSPVRKAAASARLLRPVQAEPR